MRYQTTPTHKMTTTTTENCERNNKLICGNQAGMPSGLSYVENFISEQEEQDLLQFLSSEQWSTEISRRTIQYGFRYSYKEQAIVSRMAPIPTEIQTIVDRVNRHFYPESNPINQMIINEYTGGRQGIRKHVDFGDFGPIISSLSLQNPCLMLFYPLEGTAPVYRLELRPRSLLVMRDSARYDLKHEIPSLKDTLKMGDDCCPESLRNGNWGDQLQAYSRISLTFRTMDDSTLPLAQTE